MTSPTSLPWLLHISDKLTVFAAVVIHDFICLVPRPKEQGERDWLVPLNVNLGKR